MSLLHLVTLGVALAALLAAVWLGSRARRGRWMAERELTHLGGGLLQAQEAERARIARELDDGISQQLAVLALELDAMQDRLAGLGGSYQADAAMLAQRTRTIAADVQQVTRGLHQARLEHLGLVPAVRALGHEMEHSGLQIDVSESDWPAGCPAWLRFRSIGWPGRRFTTRSSTAAPGCCRSRSEAGTAPSPSRYPTRDGGLILRGLKPTVGWES